MKCGIVGLPNVGKSTLFNCLSNAKAQSANYPFCTIEPNVGTVSVPDPRLFELEKIVKPERVLPTVVEIVDIAGLVKGASKGEGLGNQFLANIRECDAIIHMLRCFENGNIVHVEGSVDPLRDKEIIDIELQLKDLEVLGKAIEKAKKQIKSGKKEDVQTYETLVKLNEFIESGKNAREFLADDFAKSIIDEIHLLTKKPVLYVCNVAGNIRGTPNFLGRTRAKRTWCQSSYPSGLSFAKTSDLFHCWCQRSESMDYRYRLDCATGGWSNSL